MNKIMIRMLAILLTISMVMQWNATVAFADETSFSGADRQSLLQRVEVLRNQGLDSDAEPGIRLNVGTITVDADNVTSGEFDITGKANYQLELLSQGNAITEGVNWYCYTAYPENLYLPSELESAYDANEQNPNFSHYDNIAAFVDDNGYVTGKVSKGGVIIIAEYNGHLYGCTVNVRDGADTLKSFAEQKAARIIRDKDIDKLPTRAEKILAVHDFLVETVVYDKKYTQGYYEYDALFTQRAVCKGYAKTFQMFMKQLNIPCLYEAGDQDGTAHAWDIVQLDDNKWYYIDVTQDRLQAQDGSYKISYRKFLQNRKTFMAWNYQVGGVDPEEENGTEYLCYPYRRIDAFAETDSEIQRIVCFKMNAALANGSSSFRFDIVVPKESKGKPKEAIKAIQTNATVLDSYTDMGDYWLVDCDVSNLQAFENVETYEFSSAEDITEAGASTSKIKLTFSEAVPMLSKADVRIMGAHLEDVIRVDEKTYYIYIKKITIKDGGSLLIELAKPNCLFSPQSRSVTVHIEPTPEVPIEPEETSFRADCHLSEAGTVSGSLNSAMCEKILASKQDVITIDATMPQTTSISQTRMKMSVSLLKEIQSSTSSAIQILTDFGEVRVSKTLLTKLVSSRSTGNLYFVLKKEYSNSYMKYRFEIRTDKGVISAYGGSAADITVKLNNRLKGASLLRCLVANGYGDYTTVTNISKNGESFLFHASRSATYLIATKEKANSILQQQADDKARLQMKSMKLRLKVRKSGSSIKLSWTVASKTGPDYYQVYRSTKKNAGYRRIATTKKLHFKNSKGLKKGKVYYYKVRGVKRINRKNVYSSYSAKVKIRR